MSNAQAYINKTASGGTMNNYGDRFGAGTHVVAIDKLEMRKVWADKLSCNIVAVTADFIVLSSDNPGMKPGSKVSEKYDVGSPKQTAADNAGKRLNGLARAVVESLGHTQAADDLDGSKYTALVAGTLMKMLEIDPQTDLTRTSGRKYVGRGVTLKVFSKANVARKGEHVGKEFINQEFSAIAQTAEQIKQKRAAIEAPPSAPADHALQQGAAAQPPAPPPATIPAVDENMLAALGDD